MGEGKPTKVAKFGHVLQSRPSRQEGRQTADFEARWKLFLGTRRPFALRRFMKKKDAPVCTLLLSFRPPLPPWAQVPLHGQRKNIVMLGGCTKSLTFCSVLHPCMFTARITTCLLVAKNFPTPAVAFATRPLHGLVQMTVPL